MIQLFTGENSFEIERALAEMVKGFSGDVEKYDGEQLNKNKLIDILSSVSLFSTNRLVIIRGLSDNSALWSGLDDILKRLSDDVELVLVEPKPDKRTTTYKNLQKLATVRDFANWSDRDVVQAESWVAAEAKSQGIQLDKKSIQTLVFRVGMDQWALYNALQKLSVLTELNPEIIEDIIDANPQENVFNLLETAVSGDVKKLQSILHNLEKIEDPFRLVALLSSQAFQLAAVISAGPDDNPAKDFGIHPYVVARLMAISKKLGKRGVLKLVNSMADLDEQLKTSSAEPWLLLEASLLALN